MAHASCIDDYALDEIAKQVAELLPDLDEPALLNARSIEIGESFELWALGVDALVYGVLVQSNLRQLARPTGRWHHQIAFDGHAAAFARTSVPPAGEGQHVVEELFVSPLAEHIDQAIDWVDQNTSEHGDPLIRLLVAPAYHLHVFWLMGDDAQANFILPVDLATGDNSNVRADTQGALGNFQTGQLYHDSQFLPLLARSLPSLGVSLTGGPGNPPLTKSP